LSIVEMLSQPTEWTATTSLPNSQQCTVGFTFFSVQTAPITLAELKIYSEE